MTFTVILSSISFVGNPVRSSTYPCPESYPPSQRMDPSAVCGMTMTTLALEVKKVIRDTGSVVVWSYRRYLDG
jgi:hypothetical protein